MPETSDLNQHDPVTGTVGCGVTTIDAAALLDAADRSVVDTVREACLGDGFFLVEPGPDQRTAIDATLASMQSFFSLDDDDARTRGACRAASRVPRSGKAR